MERSIWNDNQNPGHAIDSPGYALFVVKQLQIRAPYEPATTRSFSLFLAYQLMLHKCFAYLLHFLLDVLLCYATDTYNMILFKKWKRTSSTKRYAYAFCLGYILGSALYLMSHNFT